MILRAGGRGHSPGRAAGPRRVGLGTRRTLLAAFALSGAVHLAAILGYALLFRGLRPEGASFPLTTSSSSSSRPQGMEVVRLSIVDETPAVEAPPAPVVEPEPEPEAEPAPSAPAEPGAPDGPPSEADDEPALSAAERLRPNLRNARLWGPANAALGNLTPAQREELRVAGRLEEWYDSVAAAAAAEAALRDWTFTDSNGDRWGVSEGKLHLGGLTLPLPFGFGIPPGKREEAADRQFQWEEIMRQGQRFDIEESWKERAEAIRARRDRERATRPDSTRGGGP